MAERVKTDRVDVAHLARLASLSLDPHEIDAMAAEVGRIVQYVNKLGDVDTEGVPAMTGGCAETQARAQAQAQSLRSDEIHPGLSHAAALDQAPRAEGGGFAVPAFLGAPKTGG
jgi:aspartyl-tRNA(Asn)/glutamyl-tRNA(Gln) amidotransferase subunit C